MSFEYISIDAAIARRGIRMVVMSQIPSPWGEAAKGILHIKRLDWAAVRLVYDSKTLADWAGQKSAPVLMYNDEPPRDGWAEILEFAERIAPEPALLPPDPAPRAQALALANDLMGREGLAWTRRLQLVHAGLIGSGGFPGQVAPYLAGKYGYDANHQSAAEARMLGLLGQFAARLRARRAEGQRYYLGSAVSAVDVYSAACMATFKPLPEAQCAMNPAIRAAFEWPHGETAAALDPVLLEHRDMMYAEHLQLPLSL